MKQRGSVKMKEKKAGSPFSLVQFGTEPSLS